MTLPVPYPADTRAKGWRFELDYERVRQSDTWALTPAEYRPWLLMLWMVAWEQTPCGSMPEDDGLICARIGMAPKAFAKARPALMRGWWLADDGRLYHKVITERVLEMMEWRQRRGYLKFKATVLQKHGESCFYCGASGCELTLDHVMPRSRGGLDAAENLVPACRPCNSSKGARTPEEWRLSHGR